MLLSRLVYMIGLVLKGLPLLPYPTLAVAREPQGRYTDLLIGICKRVGHSQTVLCLMPVRA